MGPPDRPWTRRGVLRLAGAGLAGTVAGCQLFGGPSGDTTTVTPAPVPDPTTQQNGDATTPARTPIGGTELGILLRPPAGDHGARFGNAVDLDGNRALVGAPRDRLDGEIVGAAYLFRWDGKQWGHEATFTAPRPDSWDAFGRTVSLDGDHALVGTPGQAHSEDQRSGAVHAFERASDGWEHAATLYPADGQNERFGTAVDLEGDTALVGALPISRVDAPLSGSAYVFRHGGPGWTPVRKLQSESAHDRDIFGSAVSLHGDRALVGAPRTRREEGDARPGAVHEFDGRQGWARVATFGLPEGGDRDAFGEAVALSGEWAAVSARGFEHPSGERAGAIAFLERGATSWTERATLLPPNGRASDRFGHTVALGEGVAIVGAPGETTENGRGAGAAYAFERRENAWSLRRRLVMGYGAQGDNFGKAVTIADRTGLVGAIGDVDREGNRAGSVTVLGL